jgi:hypothetical protein
MAGTPEQEEQSPKPKELLPWAKRALGNKWRVIAIAVLGMSITAGGYAAWKEGKLPPFSRPPAIAIEKPPEPSPTPFITPSETPLPTSTPEPTQTPTPTETPRPTEMPTPLPTSTPTETPTPTKTPRPPETPKPQEMVATGNVDVYLSPDGKKVGYLVPGQRFTFTGKTQGEWKQINAGGDILWIKGGSYGPVGKVETPTPGEKCKVNCEAYRDLNLYRSPADKEPFSRLVPGTNKVFVVKNRSGDWMLIEVTEPNGAKWQAWAKDVPGTYGPVGKVTPVPKTPEPSKPLVTPVPLEILREVGRELSRNAFAPDTERLLLGEAERIIYVDGDMVTNDLERKVIKIITLKGGRELEFYYEGARLSLINEQTVHYITFDAKPSDLPPPGWRVTGVRVYVDPATLKVTGILVWVVPEG